MVPIAGMEELTSFNHLFWSKTRKNLTDGHIWFSVFHRPPTSRFTRVQRVTCCIALLFSSMLASIAFYKADGGDAPKVVRSRNQGVGLNFFLWGEVWGGDGGGLF